MAVKWEKVSRAIFGTKYDYNQSTLHDAGDGSVCVQGALWLGMKSGKEEDIEGSDVLTREKEKKVCRYYGLERSVVGEIPEVNDEAAGSVPKTVFAWLWLTHDKKRMELLRRLAGTVWNSGLETKAKAARLLKKMDKEIVAAIERVLDEVELNSGDLMWAAAIEFIVPSFGAQYFEEAKKIGALDRLLEQDVISKELHRRMTNFPPTGGWKKYIQKANKR